MKSPKGFRGKYFSLAAILALNATLTLASNVQSVVDTQEQLSTPRENATSEEETLVSELALPVMVVSKKIKVSEVGAPFASEVYSKKEIEKSHSKELYEFLNTQTSISTLPAYGNSFSQKIDMRGYGMGDGYENVVISLNGRRLNNIDMSPQLLSSISLDSIEKIEIIKGSGSVEYGDGANAGVINILTKDTDGAVLKSYIGDNGLWFGSLGVGVKEEKFTLSGYIDNYSHDGFKEVSHDGTKDDSWSRNTSLKLTVNPMENVTLNLSKAFLKMDVTYANALTLAQYNQDIYTIPTSLYSDTLYQSDVLNYGIGYKVNEHISIDAQVFDEAKKVKSYYASSGGRIDGSYAYNSYDAKLNYTHGNLKALMGLQGFDGEKKTQSTWSPDNTVTKENLGIYAKADYALGNNTFSAGARNESIHYTFNDSLSHLKDTYSQNAYDAGYNYKLTNTMSFFTNLNHSFQAPNIDRLFSASYDAFWNYAGTVFNGFIEPMKADTLNIGINYLSTYHTMKMTVFLSSIENEIYYNNATYTNTNLKKTEKKGLEFYDKYNLLSNVFTTLNYTYVNTKIVDDGLSGYFNGRHVPGVSPHTIKVGLGYSPRKPITLLLSETYKSRAYAMDDFDGSYGKMPSYCVSDFSATYIYKNYEFFAKINNILDEKNAMFSDSGAKLGVYPINYERTFMVGFNARF
jgi:iron complex outermembrane recepter protein